MNTDFTGHTIAGGRYEVRERLGSGSMGHILLAYDRNLGTTVVVKVPTLARLENPEFARRFAQESRFLVRLKHPQIVSILDVGEHENIPFFVMQYIGAGSLEDRARSGDGGVVRASTRSLREWLPGVAQALDFMHREGYIHRDVKPGNILFDEHGNAFLSDFGLSKVILAAEEGESSMTAAGAVVGTPNYVAPEIVLGRPYDGRADQYSLAITVYEVLTGSPPLEGPTASATMVNQTSKQARPLHEVRPDISPRLSSVVHKALSKQPENRYRSCAEFADAVLAAVDVTPTDTSRSSAHPGSTAVMPRKRLAVVATSKAANGRVGCPSCGKMLYLRPEHAGQRGKCVQCGGRLMIARDLQQISLLRPVEASESQIARGVPGLSGVGNSTSDDFDTILGQDVFGLRLARWQATSLAVLTLVGIVVAAVVLTRILHNPEGPSRADIAALASREGGSSGRSAPAAPARTVELTMLVPEKSFPAYRNAGTGFMQEGIGQSVRMNYEQVDARAAIDRIVANDEAFELWCADSPFALQELKTEWSLSAGGSSSEPPVTRSEVVAFSPMVCVLWSDRYWALRKKYPDIQLASLLDAMRDPSGWSAIVPTSDWGTVKIGAPPLDSDIGQNILLMLAMSLSDKADDLQKSDVTSTAFRKQLGDFERLAIPPGTAGDDPATALIERVMLRGPEYLDGAIVPESVALKYLDRLTQFDAVRLVYLSPRVDMVQQIHAVRQDDPSRRQAASVFVDTLLTPEFQRAWIYQGMRPGNPSVSLTDGVAGSPFAERMGVEIPESLMPSTVLPDAAVIEELLRVHAILDR
ncbi:Serine/threonine-protein kinase PknB [Maioricimonas rarisocia]|uniref:non-specific serine/threonine protein kinase n=1 Tax=Maioricimonas rarisocia TaxID=2528026 RepID=A0A517Z147_9PLAN|nr:serine/threonine-protein kinase [Maioricimonas rarisocia]QDU36207.1 Serine/threonine-protein kinase PknB [Maioricimonas rarisocia]